jgi:heme/copper-type cytochrome/quinol oxidase subunit 1
MKQKIEVSKTEIFIIAVILILLMILWFFDSILPGSRSFDMDLHGTYFIFWGKVFVLPVLLLVTVIYLIKEAFYGYKRRFQNLVLLTCFFVVNVILFFGVSFLYNIASQTGANNRGWIIYPPLSAMPRTLPDGSFLSSALFSNISHILLFIQIFFLLILVIIAVLTGKNWNVNKREQELS